MASAALSNLGALSASSIKYGLIYLPVGQKFPAQTWTRCFIDTTDFIAGKTVLGVWPRLIYGNTQADGSGSTCTQLIPVIYGWFDNMKQLSLMVYNNADNDAYIVEDAYHYLHVSYVSTS